MVLAIDRSKNVIFEGEYSMKILMSLALLVSVVGFANAQESPTPSGASHCSNTRFDDSVPSSSTQSVSEEIAPPTTIIDG